MAGRSTGRKSKLTAEQKKHIENNAANKTALKLSREINTDLRTVYNFLRWRKIQYIRIKGSGSQSLINKN